MKILKINNKDYVVKFTSKVIRELNAKGITLNSLAEDIQNMNTTSLYDAFYYAIKDTHKVDLNQALEIIDSYYEENEDNDIESFFKLVLEEYAKAMGLGKKFKEIMTEQVK